MITANCPECKSAFKVSAEAIEDAIGCTTDCPECEALLVFADDGSVQDFHKWMHEQDDRWPVDGKGTDYIEM